MIVAPVNPADINTIQGMYPVKPTLPSTPGFEGIGEVVATGPAVDKLVPGDRVITDGAIGTWCTAGVFESDQLRKVSTLMTRVRNKPSRSRFWFTGEWTKIKIIYSQS